MKSFRPMVLKATPVLLMSVLLATQAYARDLELAPQGRDDLVARTLVSTGLRAEKAASSEQAPVQFSWALPADQTISAQLPPVAESREFWTRVSAAELSRGKQLRTSAPGALIRLSPIANDRTEKALSIDPFTVEIVAHGKTYARGEAMKNAANSAELKAAGADFPDGSLAFQLKTELGQGEIALRVPKANRDYLVHVFEPNSQEVLSLRTDRLTAQHGGELTVIARFNDGQAVEAIGGFISAPNGEQVELTFVRSGQDYQASLRHDGLRGEGAGLWEVHAFASRAGVMRDAKTAMASSVPRARLNGVVKQHPTRDGSVKLNFGVEVGAAGRYEVRGTLYGVDRNGKTVRAGAIAASAARLARGQQSLDLVFDAMTLSEADLRAPFSIRDLTLIDQGSLAVQEQRAFGLRLP